MKSIGDTLRGQRGTCIRCRQDLEAADAVPAQMRLVLGGTDGPGSPPQTVLVCRSCACTIATEQAAPVCESCNDRTSIVEGFWTCTREECVNEGMQLRPATPEEIVDLGWNG